MSPRDEKLLLDQYLIQHIGMIGVASDNCLCFDCMQQPLTGEFSERKFSDLIMQKRNTQIEVMKNSEARKLIGSNKLQQQIDVKNIQNQNLKLNTIAISILTLLYSDVSINLETSLIKIEKRVKLLQDLLLD